jgi:hypothetical protein
MKHTHNWCSQIEKIKKAKKGSNAIPRFYTCKFSWKKRSKSSGYYNKSIEIRILPGSKHILMKQLNFKMKKSLKHPGRINLSLLRIYIHIYICIYILYICILCILLRIYICVYIYSLYMYIILCILLRIYIYVCVYIQHISTCIYELMLERMLSKVLNIAVFQWSWL